MAPEKVPGSSASRSKASTPRTCSSPSGSSARRRSGWAGDEGADDRVVIFGAPDHIYSARERDDGRVVVHNINELQDMKAGRNGERMPLNVTRTLVVRISDEPTEDEQDEAGALDKVARRFSPRRAPPRKD